MWWRKLRHRTGSAWLALTLCAVAGLHATSLCADQTDPRLDALFAKLDDAETRAEGRRLANEIWSIWYEHDDPAVSRAMRRRELGAALAAFDRAVRLDPEFAEAWNKRATIHFMLGNDEKSLRDIERVLELEPRHFGALAGRGLCYMRLDKLNKAVKAFERSLDIHPRQPGTRARINKLRDKLGMEDI